MKFCKLGVAFESNGVNYWEDAVGCHHITALFLPNIARLFLVKDICKIKHKLNACQSLRNVAGNITVRLPVCIDSMYYISYVSY